MPFCNLSSFVQGRVILSKVLIPARERALAALRSVNAKLVLRELLMKGARSRVAIAHATGLTETAVSRATQKLIAEGVIVEGRQVSAHVGPGRPSVELEFGAGYFVAGIGIRGYAQWVEVRRLDGKSFVSEPFACSELTDPIAVLRRCCDELDALLKSSRIPRHRVLRLGVLIAGVVDPASGTVLRAENLGWRRVEVTQILQSMVPYCVDVETILNGMNFQQAFHEGRPAKNTLLVNVALGIGASLVVNEGVTRGTGFAAGQLGHMRSRTSTIECVCGRIGCLDTIASGRAILKSHGKLKSEQQFHAPALVEHFRELSSVAYARPDVARSLMEAGKELGRAVGSAIALLDPEEIVFTGFVTEDDHFFNAVLDELTWYRTGSSAQRVECVRRQQSGERAASLIAAIGLCSDTSFQ